MTPCGSNAVFLPCIPSSCFRPQPIQCYCDLPIGAEAGHLPDDVDCICACAATVVAGTIQREPQFRVTEAGKGGTPESGPSGAGSPTAPPKRIENSAEQKEAESATSNPEFQVEFSTDSKNVQEVARVVSPFFQDNPRRLKQFINVYRLRAFIAYETGVLGPGKLTPQQLGKLIALQLRWPVWASACLRDRDRLQVLSGDKPIDLAGVDPGLKALLDLGRGDSFPGSAWDLQGADLEGFVRVSPVIRTVDLDRIPEARPVVTSFAQGAPSSAVSASREVADQIPGNADEALARILWVDDKPSNNTDLKAHIEHLFYVEFSFCISTEEAVRLVTTEAFALVISDMGRPGDSHAGYTLLKKLRENGNNAPFLIYTMTAGGADKDEARKRGALDITDKTQDVLNAVAKIARPTLQEATVNAR